MNTDNDNDIIDEQHQSDMITVFNSNKKNIVLSQNNLVNSIPTSTPAPQTNIAVYVRIRPFNQKQSFTQSIIHPSTNTQLIKIVDKQNNLQHQFTFDNIFDEKSTQLDVYNKVGKDVVEFAFDGFNGTIFAYGQTSSGKTHTCLGPDYYNEQYKGILPRLVSQIFTKISTQPSYLQFRIKISMLQIYLQKLRDLFNPLISSQIRIRESKSKGIYLQNITQQYVSSVQQLMLLFDKGINNRSIASTNMNDISSRSHMVFMITIYQNNLKDSSAKSGKIILVDLAGSQKVGKTLAEGKVLEEAKSISKSLSALGNVINALTDVKKGHVPYRDSKLTRILQESLGGNSRTRLIINVSPSAYNFAQSLSSLRFGIRAKLIKNKPRVNKEYTVAELLLLLEKSQARVQQLQKILSQLTSSKKKQPIISKISKGPHFVQNLLDSDNPILMSQTQGQNEYNSRSRQLSGIKQYAFESQFSLPSQDQQIIRNNNNKFNTTNQKNKFSTPTKINCNSSSSSSNINKPPSLTSIPLQQFKKISCQWQMTKNQLLQTIQSISIQKQQFQRQLTIFEQKYRISQKQTKMLSSKFKSLKRQNQILLEKAINQKLKAQQEQQKAKIYEIQVKSYEESIRELMGGMKKISQKNDKVQKSNIEKVFGTPQKNIQTSKLIEKYQKYQNENQKHNSITQKMLRLSQQQQQTRLAHHLLSQQSTSIRSQNQFLRRQLKQLQSDISLFKNLQQSRELLIKQKLQFVDQKSRIYKDLQNRIQKVLQLQQLLDNQKQLTKSLKQIIQLSQSQKGRRILQLEKYVNQVSENYYVLKGQQSAWGINNKKYQEKIEKYKNKISKLEEQIMELKTEVLTLQSEREQYEKDVFDVDFDVYDYENSINQKGNEGVYKDGFKKKQARIEKVVTSKKINKE